MSGPPVPPGAVTSLRPTDLPAGLHGLLLGVEALDLTLTRVAHFAVESVPGADGAGLTLLRGARRETVVATDLFVEAVDNVQYRLGEGPCLSAVAESRSFVSENLGGETRWPRFGPRAGRAGIHSSLSLPLVLPGRVVGSLNLYAHAKSAFDDRAVLLGQSFASVGAVTVANAQALAHADRLAGELRSALTSRAVIDQAIGVVMSRRGIGAEEAFERLRALSQDRNVKVSEIARELLSEAVRRARPRPGLGTER